MAKAGKKVINPETLRGIDAYEHADKQRADNPKIGAVKDDKKPDKIKTYAFDPNLDPSLEWAGKKEGLSFDVPTSAIHIHESIKPSKVLKPVQTIYANDKELDGQGYLFEEFDPVNRMKARAQALSYYQHGVNWTNRLIAGDSLVIMNSLLEKEGMAGQVQMVYIDPPYGIKYGSNFQPFTNDVSFKSSEKDEDLSQEPEMIKAFRDTWELGIHSYLSYLRNRLLMTRELLSESGSVFVQIGDENVHLIRILCDEIFGPENFVSQITIKKGSVMFAKKLLNSATFYIIWYAKNKEHIKFKTLFSTKEQQDFADTCGSHLWCENIDTKDTLRISPEDRKNIDKFLMLHPGYKLFGTWSLNAQGVEKQQGYLYEGKKYYPPRGTQWKTSFPQGLDDLKKNNRLQIEGETLRVKLYYDDYPISKINNLWTGIGAVNSKIYVVQTSTELPKRCMLMTTDPGDLVLDITCGSGTTAYVAEQWGRRWITCDTSRIALELAKERLITATFDYYKLKHPDIGVSGGFIYKTAPHVTIGDITNGNASESEILYDQPEIDKTKVRVSGPFTVEALPAPIGITDAVPLDETTSAAPDSSTMTTKQDNWRDELLKTGIVNKGGERIRFTRLEPMKVTTYFQAEGETTDGKHAVVCFGSENKVMDARYVYQALEESTKIFPHPDYVVIAAFQFGPEAKDLMATAAINSTVLNVQMNADLMTEDLRKGQRSSQSFWLIGQPDVSIVKHGSAKNRYKVIVNGFDYFDVKTGKVIPGGKNDIAMWMLDIDYDGLCVEPEQVFFPMGGKDGGWKKLAKTLKAEINPDLIEKYAGNESLWFNAKPNQPIAVKIIDNRGIESLRVLKVGKE